MITEGATVHVTKLSKDEAAHLVTRLCRENAQLRAENTRLNALLDHHHPLGRMRADADLDPA